MNEHDMHEKSTSKGMHGTMKSYITGFILSLFLTINAYFLVVTKSVSGTTLAATILVFAVLQMAVQVFFFLHLGRGPKPLYNVVFFGGTASLILVVIVGSIFIMNNLQYNMSPSEVTKKLSQEESIYQVGGEKTGACEAIKTNHKITIKNKVVSPSHTLSKLCDTLTFINEDGSTHTVVFGVYPQTTNYGGNAKISIPKSYAKTITLNQAGSFRFYDELDPQVSGSFTVSN